MNKKAIELSMTTLIGLLVGVALAIGIIFVAVPFIEVFTSDMGSEDNSFLESSMDELESIIYGIEEGETKDILFYSFDKFNIYLNSYNNDSDVTECFSVPCIALCSDDICEDVLFYRAFSDVVFSSTGIITKIDLEDGNSGRFLMYVEKVDGKVSFRFN